MSVDSCYRCLSLVIEENDMNEAEEGGGGLLLDVVVSDDVFVLVCCCSPYCNFLDSASET